MIEIKRLSVTDTDAATRWDSFVLACDQATFFHRAGWQRVLNEVFRHETYFLYADNDGVKDAGSASNELQVDWLFSYRPTPGTLAYLGYGSTMHEPDDFRFRNLRRSQDGFFGKVSYVFRL